MGPLGVRLGLIAGAALAVGAGVYACKTPGVQSDVFATSSVDHAGDPLWEDYQRGINYGTDGLDDDAKKGRLIWYFATSGNGRYHSIVLPQYLGLPADYYDVFGSFRRGRDRFKKWGVIPDPSCMTPEEAEQRFGSDIWPDPNFKSFGFDVCPGDLGPNGLLAAIGRAEKWKNGYWVNDPACEIDCQLHFGTSAGGMGFRKFPNPRFNPKKWERIGGWKGFSREGGYLTDHSVEPPFLIGHSCGSCHIAYNPEKPPANPELPRWENVNGLVGNQYLHISEILGSGMPRDSLEWQVFTHARPGTTDTSAVTHDNVNNPGTINAILNTNRRPGIVNSGLPGASVDDRTRYKPPRHTFKYYGLGGEPGWKTFHDELVPQILKGGEDTVSAHGAVQRVYLNIGMCAEACMLNNLQDLRAIVGRKSRQTPFRIDQCFRDCPEFRAIARNTTNVFKFLVEQQAFDLHRAKGLESRQELAEQLGKDKVELGMRIFAAKCARCHSSRVDPQTPPAQLVNMLTKENSPYYLLREDERGRLEDWFGNDARTEATEVGSYRCRALHSNHMEGHLWEQYGSFTMRRAQVPSGIAELKGANTPDGRGYYRNISLLSLWAFAPFMHNNALGMELCSNDFPIGPWARGNGCHEPDPSVEGRLKMFEASLKALFRHPDYKRVGKITRTDKDIVVPLGPKVKVSGAMRGIELRIPKGLPVTLLGSIDQRKLVRKILNDISSESNASAGFAKFARHMQDLYDRGPDGFAKYLRQQDYINCGQPLNDTGDVDLSDIEEDMGHDFLKYSAGAPTNIDDELLNEEEFQALYAFLQLI